MPKKPLIPDFNTISNELWIIIGLFIFNIINKIELSETKKKKEYRNIYLLNIRILVLYMINVFNPVLKVAWKIFIKR